MEVTIDGKKVELHEPVSVLEAARQAGVRIPTLCWHPRVSVLGACRLCMVEVEGINRLLAACTTQVSDGMTVFTDTPQLKKVRQTMMELLLCRHPLDCPTCVKGGECELQELAYTFSDPKNRFPENPAPYPVKDPSPALERDPKKCVLCRRCVRVCREVRGVTVLGAMERGYHKRVGTFFQRPLDSDFQEPYNCEFCGACIDICPVGALNSKQRKFRARTWEGDRTDTVCPFCSVGCLLTLQVKEGELVRTLPREGPNNEDQACFRGRFGCDYANGTARLVTPLLRREGKQVPADRGEALAFLAGKLRAGGSVEALVSSSLTSEEAAAVREFMEGHLPQGTLRAVDTLGLEESISYEEVGGGSFEDLGEADLVLAVGQDFTAFNPVAGVRIRVSRGKTGAPLVMIDPRDALLGGEADLWLRPAGAALPLLLTGLLAELKASHGEGLKGSPRDLPDALPAGSPQEVERALGLAAGTLADLAGRLSRSENPVFLSHRGWYDPAGRVPVLLTEIRRLLTGSSSRGVIFLGRDCNSRGVAGITPVNPGERDLLLVFGADPRGTALPGSSLSAITEKAAATVVFDTYPTKTALEADLVIPLPHFAEKEGSFRACNGLDQRLEGAMAPPPGVLTLGETLGEAAKLMAGAGPRATAAEGKAGETREEADGLSLPPAGERHLVLRAIPAADHRLRMVPESAPFFPGERAEVHPGDLGGLGLEAGGQVRLSSGEADLELEVVADLKTPPGQIHLPLDPENEKLAAFAAAAHRPEGWPPDLRRLTSVERVEPAGKEGRG